MVLYNCQECNYSTSNKYNYNKHLKTSKHLLFAQKKVQQNVENVEKNVENVELQNNNTAKENQHNSSFDPKESISKNENQCFLCCKTFSRIDSLKRHLSICSLSKKDNVAPKGTKVHQKSDDHKCLFCQQKFSRRYTLNRHYERCKLRENNQINQNQLSQLENDYQRKLLEKDLEKEKALNKSNQELLKQKDETIKIAKNSKATVTHITNYSTNKTINYLNSNYGEMIAMDKFLHNLQHTEQLTHEERQQLLMSYKDSGIELFARSFSHVMKENCRRQLLKEGLPEMDIIPLYCSDGNLRSHKEKDSQGWKTRYDDQSLNTMINISSQQVYQSCQKPLMIFGKERNKVFKQIKQDNHSQKEIRNKLIDEHKE